MMRQYLIVCLALCAGLSGCAARESVVPVVPVPEEVPAAPSFGDRVAALPEGSAHAFAESPFGPAVIEAGPFYLSGLGDECRSARVTRGTGSHRFALCREENGEWRFIPTVFESMPQ